MRPGRGGWQGRASAYPCIDIETMLDLTAAAEVGGVKFDGFDLFLYPPDFNIDAGDDEIKRLAGKATSRGLVDPLRGGPGLGADRRAGDGRSQAARSSRPAGRGGRVAGPLASRVAPT